MLGRLWLHPGKLAWLVIAVALLGLVAISCSAPAPAKPAATTPSEPAVTKPAETVPVTPPVTPPPAAPPAVPPAQTTTTSGPPQIPHTLEGRDNCLMCHSIGAAGVGVPGGMGLTPAHEGRTIEMCRGCHQPKA